MVSPEGRFIEFAQNLTPEKSQGGRKAEHVTVTHPFGDHALSCLTLNFESEYSCSAPLTLVESRSVGRASRVPVSYTHLTLPTRSTV